MKFDIFFDISVYVMALIGFYSLVLSDTISQQIFLIMVIPVMLGFLSDRKKISIPDFSRINTPLLLLFFLFTIFRIFTGTDILDALSHLTIVVQLAKILSQKRGKDYLYIFSISFLQLLVASVMTTSLAFAIVFIIYTVAATWAFMGYNLREQIDEHESISISLPIIRLSPHFIITTVCVIFLSFFITAILFMVIPRLGSGLILPAVSRKIIHTGFSHEVDLEKSSIISENSSIIMRARPLGKIENLNNQLIWRGVAFDTFDGLRWTQSSDELYALNPVALGVFSLSHNIKDTNPLAWEIYLEPLGTTSLFIPYGTYRININFQRLFYDERSNLYLPFAPGECIVYRIESSSNSPLIIENHINPNSSTYLSLPPLTISIKELTEKITSTAKNNFEKAELIEKYLRENYSYSLTDNPTNLDDFLFIKKKGHCELFATAMTVMLRLSGIPARLVSGFIGGEWNHYGKYFMIRQKDAHTWVEAFLEPYGWIVFDPTPPSGKKEHYNHILKAAYVYIDFIKHNWQRYIISYNIYDQITILRKIRETNQKWKNQTLTIREYFEKKIKNYKRSIIIYGISLLTAFGITLLFYSIKRNIPFLRKLSHKTRRYHDCTFYYEVLDILSKKGLVIRPSQTPLEFLDYVKQKKHELAHIMEKLTSLYLNVRFGEKILNEQEKQIIRNMINEIRKK